MPTPPAAFDRGVTLFNAGHWWEAHEAWETLWLPARDEERAFYQALILLAAALHKRWHHGSLTHRNYHKARRYLQTLPDEYRGVNLRQLSADVWTGLHDPERRPRITIP